MEDSDPTADLGSDDPAVGLRAVGALHRLAEQVEATNVKLARDHGFHGVELVVSDDTFSTATHLTLRSTATPSSRAW